MRGEKIRQHTDESPGLYVHVPFCKTKCPYCDFYSVTDLAMVEAWFKALSREIELYRDEFGTFDTLYIGGGTPTVLDNWVLASLFEKLDEFFTFSDNIEITVEANPDDVTPDKLDALKALHVNRLSMGVQSFNDGELKFLQRRHSVLGAENALHAVQEKGFTNLGIDLMYGLPGQSIQSWSASLRAALTVAPTHLSCYQFTIESSTPFGSMMSQGRLRACDEEQGRRFFLFTSKFLEEHGFTHYEISNFSKGTTFRSRHNCKYWHHIPYLGLGPGAHSFRNGVRWWNHRSVERYCDDLRKGLKPVADSEVLSAEQSRLERLFLGFRTRDGVAMEDAFPRSLPTEALDNMTGKRLVTVSGDRIVPTKKGFLVADRLPLLLP